MLNIFWNMWMEYKFEFYQRTNHVIYFFQRIPIIGKKIKDKIYSLDDYKIGIGIFCFLISIINRFFRIFIPLLFYSAAIFMYKVIFNNKLTFNEGKNLLIVIFWILSMIMGSFVNSKIYEFSKDEYLLFKVMKTNVKFYYLRKIFLKLLSESIAYFFLFFILFSVKKAIILISLLASYRLIGAAFEVIKGKYVKVKNDKLDSILNIGLLIVVILMFISLKYSEKVFLNFIFNPIIMLFTIVVGIISAIYMYMYKDYYKYVKVNLTKESAIGFSEFMNSIEKETVNNIQEDKLKSEELDSSRFQDKSGYEYLNEIFFVRNSKIINKPLKYKCVFILLFFVGLNILILFLNSKYRNSIWDQFGKLTTGMVFLMYIFSSGRNIIKSLFYYCDRSLLKYGYYRKGDAVLKNFYLRIKKVILIDFIPALLICIGLIISTISLGHISDFIKIVPLLLCILVLPVFYSVYYMAIYYLFQPYTSEMENVSPIFKFASGFIYLISYMSINYRGNQLFFAFIVLIVTIISTLVSLILVYIKAPKTFKIK